MWTYPKISGTLIFSRRTQGTAHGGVPGENGTRAPACWQAIVAMGVLSVVGIVLLMVPSFVLAQQCTTKPAPGGTTDWLNDGGNKDNQCGGGAAGAGGAVGSASAGSMNLLATEVGAGNPINLTSGNKYQQDTDLPALPGTLGLEVVRHYNSAYSDTVHNPGLVGRGWRLSYETQLLFIGNTLQVAQADGSRVIFNRDPDNPSQCSSSDPAHGRLLIHQGASTRPSYIWVWPGAGPNGGRRLYFNAQGQLEQITEASGEALSLQYDTRGRLLQVTDPQQRQLKLNYLSAKDEAAGRAFSGVQSIDTPVGRIEYRYGTPLPEGSSHPVQVPMSNLAAVDPPDGRSRRYHYEDPRYPSHLTGISVQAPATAGTTTGTPTQRLSTWAYDEQGRAVLSLLGERAAPTDKMTGEAGQEQVRVVAFQAPGVKPGYTEIENSLGQKTRYTHESIAGQARLTSAIGPGCARCAPTQRRWRYDSQGRLTEEIQLDTQGRPVQGQRWQRDGVGRIVKVSRVAYRGGKGGNQVQAVEELFSYGYPALAQASASTSPEYQAAWQPVEISRPSVVPGQRHRWQVQINERGQVVEVQESGWSPALAGQPPEPLHRSTRYEYRRINGRSLLSAIDGPLPNGPSGTPQDSDITQLLWDERGDAIIEQIRPGRLSQKVMERDRAGRVVRIEDEEGRQTAMALNFHGLPTSMRRAGESIQLTYNEDNRVTQWVDSSGKSWTAEYDISGRLIATIDAHGIRHQLSHDTEGKTTKSIWRDAQGQQAFDEDWVRYDAWGRPVESSDGRKYTYDAVGQLTTMVDALERVTQLSHDGWGRVVSVLKPDQGHVQLGYEAIAGLDRKPTRLLAANGAVHVKAWDDFGRVVRHEGSSEGQTYADYDVADRLITVTHTAMGQQTRWIYDAAGRVIQRVSSARGDGDKQNPQGRANPDITVFHYQGRRLSARANQHQSDGWEYDEQGRVIARSTWIARDAPSLVPLRFDTQYRYDAQGRLAEQILPDGLRLQFNWTSQGVMQQLKLIQKSGASQTLVDGLKADSLYGLRELTLGNGLSTTWSRDKNSRINTWKTKVSSTQQVLAGAKLHYDPGHRIEAVEDLAGQPRSQYQYDAANRLIEVTQGEAVQRWTYDLNGNRRQSEDATGEVAYSYGRGNDRLLQRQVGVARPGAGSGAPPGPSWFYDGMGRPRRWQAAMGWRQDDYGANGRLCEVWAQDEAKRVSYRYDSAGQRVAKTREDAGGVRSTTYVLYENNQRVADVDAQGRITAHYVYLGQALLAKIESDVGEAAQARQAKKVKVLWAHSDHRGAPVLLTDKQGRSVWSAKYEPFGKAQVNEDVDGDGQAITLDLRFPGQWLDHETGTHHNYFRDYDPETGRYLQPDPIGVAGGMNTYVYANGDPMQYIDPLGLKPWDWDGQGDTSVCSYYDEMAKQYAKCAYYKRAGEICRGDDPIVNEAIRNGLRYSWATGKTTNSQSVILTNIRKDLIAADKKARAEGKVNCQTGCVLGNEIDAYHNVAFENSGVSRWFYGGNLWPQDCWPNPVPKDPENALECWS